MQYIIVFINAASINEPNVSFVRMSKYTIILYACAELVKYVIHHYIG